MKHIAVIALLFCFANAAWGAGYQLRYQGAESMGTAFSSAGSYGTSLSSIYYNPALFLTQEKDKAMSLELMVLNPTTSKFTSSTNTVEDDFADTGFSGSLYYGYLVDNETALTISITTPWGTETDYGTTWEGRYAATNTKLVGINFQPMVSKKLSKKFMFSIGPQIQHLSGELGFARSLTPLTPNTATDYTANFDGDSLSVGGVLALTYIMSENTTFGFNYTSRVKHNLKGDLKFSANAAAIPPIAGGPFVNSDDAETEIVTPDVFTLSATQKMTEKMLGHFSVSYTNWSVFKDLTLNANNVLAGGLAPISTTVSQNWEDTYFVALGTTYKANSVMTFRGGLSYETGAVENEFRTPRSQDTDRIGLGLGASFSLGHSMQLDLGINHIEYTGDVEMDVAADLAGGKPGIAGDYDVSATLLRMGLEYTF